MGDVIAAVGDTGRGCACTSGAGGAVIVGAANDGIAGAANDGIVGAANDGIAGAANDGIVGAANDGIAGAANDGIVGAANDGIVGAANDGIVGAANDGIVGAANDGIVGAANDGIVGAANDGIPGMEGSKEVPNIGIAGVSTDGAPPQGDAFTPCTALTRGGVIKGTTSSRYIFRQGNTGTEGNWNVFATQSNNPVAFCVLSNISVTKNISPFAASGNSILYGIGGEIPSLSTLPIKKNAWKLSHKTHNHPNKNINILKHENSLTHPCKNSPI